MKNAMNQVFPAMIHERPTRSIPVDGLTKRELFTGMVAAGSSDCEIVDVQRFARYCVKVADALLLALEEAQ